MSNRVDYREKFVRFEEYSLYRRLTEEQRKFLREAAFEHRLTFQEFRQLVEACRDLDMWGETPLADWWKLRRSQAVLQGGALKRHLLEALRSDLEQLRGAAKRYPEEGFSRPKKREKNLQVTDNSQKSIFGMCPVASEKTVCCQLHTIDAVENCIFGCSYCTIQTFYSDRIVFQENLPEKLRAIQLDPQQFYHIGTGQSSDSLAWGNRHSILDALMQFAADHPNVLLELKTKSDNIRYFLEGELPGNIVCSWSLNTPTIIRNEEHFTADLERRIGAARRLADRGIRVAFHFHPLVYYQDWEKEYPAVADTLLREFRPEEVLFVSFGSVTMIKPVVQKIRQSGYPTKILQMELVPDPHGKLTYPDDLKVNMFRTMYEAFKPWRETVFMYLCMEKANIWKRTLGYTYPDNQTFADDFQRQVQRKLSM